MLGRGREDLLGSGDKVQVLQVDLQVVRAFSIEEYKALRGVPQYGEDLYSARMDNAVKLLDPKTPKLDVSDLNDESETLDDVPEEEFEAVEQ